jgi:hypothetical protein
MGFNPVYLEVGATSRILELSGEGVHGLVRRGVLRPAAKTARGVLLFEPQEVERVRRLRAGRRQVKAEAAKAG